MYRELIALLRRDDQLHQRWVEIRARGFAGFHELFNLFVAAGVLRDPGDPVVVTCLAELVWLISEFWLASVEVSSATVDAAQMERGVMLMLQVLGPFIVARPKRAGDQRQPAYAPHRHAAEPTRASAWRPPSIERALPGCTDTMITTISVEWPTRQVRAITLYSY